jgi:hypothetical protein
MVRTALCMAVPGLLLAALLAAYLNPHLLSGALGLVTSFTYFGQQMAPDLNETISPVPVETSANLTRTIVMDLHFDTPPARSGQLGIRYFVDGEMHGL